MEDAILDHTKGKPGGGERKGWSHRPMLRPPPRASRVAAARDSMATACRPLNLVLLPALRSSVYPGVGGSGPTCCRCPLGAKRYLLTDNIVKLKEFQNKKVAIAHNLPGTKESQRDINPRNSPLYFCAAEETYLRSLEEKLTQNKLILRDELRILLHLCDSRDEVELAKNVIYRYHAENRNVTLGEYKFGPLFIRLCYELDLEESGVELIKDQHLRGFFSDATSFNILMDILFIKGKYQSALEVLIEMKNQDVKFSKDTYVLAFAICYKLNSPESFKICTTLREEALIKGEVLSRRASCFAVALALNQVQLWGTYRELANKVAKAVSFFSQILKPESIICTNLNELILREQARGQTDANLLGFQVVASGGKEIQESVVRGMLRESQLMIHIQSNMLKDLIDILKEATEENLSRFVKKHEFSEEVLTKVREKVKDVPELVARFDEILGKLYINGQVTTYTLDALLCHTPRNRSSHLVQLNKRTVSRRTFQPLSQSLWAE
ncbi:Pentatricopeptide repeat-containing protein 2, mitochondrial [Galemys pyrenaicus]|uniref:Pentatricopeptide repeat-containing protein 2, mitochondrial n=1 Tax=Galemys pyrenaicus TaxID=202257 RepID=A0A8J6AN47_GALPY|nr:Pentatricopeptide repeat-containing protein 2, mitochondrial [Galemys pyrenaicus]